MKPGRRADNLTILAAACQRVRRADTQNFRSDANVEPFPRLGELMQEMIPGDPSRREYRQGYTLAEAYRHWFRVKFFGRFRLFFRYDSRSRIIVYTRVDDERSLRQRGGKSDPYEVFRRMLASGNPPNEWAALVRNSNELPGEILSTVADGEKRADNGA